MEIPIPTKASPEQTIKALRKRIEEMFSEVDDLRSERDDLREQLRAIRRCVISDRCKEWFDE